MTLQGVNAQLLAGLEAVVHLARTAQGGRVVAEIAVLSRRADEPVVEAALRHQAGRLVAGPAVAQLAGRLGIRPGDEPGSLRRAPTGRERGGAVPGVAPGPPGLATGGGPAVAPRRGPVLDG